MTESSEKLRSTIITLHLNFWNLKCKNNQTMYFIIIIIYLSEIPNCTYFGLQSQGCESNSLIGQTDTEKASF